MRAVAVLAAAITSCVAPIDYDGGATDTDPPEPTGPVATTHDEDLDGIDDASDRCPTVADLDGPPLDRDGDGVGDGCDPQPGRPNALAYLATFDPAADAAPWRSEGAATWSVIDDALEPSGPTAGSAAHAPVTFAGPLQVVARITVLDTTADPEISLFDAYDPDRRSGDECQVAVAGGTLTNIRVVDGEGDATAAATVTITGPVMVAGQPLTLTAQRDAATVRCHHAAGAEVTTAARATVQPPAGAIRVGAGDATIRVHSVIAYTLDPD